MNKIDYVTAVLADFDMGVQDSKSSKPASGIGGGYNAGYHGWNLPETIRPFVQDTAGRGWDDGASGAAKIDTPKLDVAFANDSVLLDLKNLYNESYEAGHLNASGGASSGKSYTGWIAAAAAVVIGGGVLYAMNKRQEQRVPALATANPSNRRHVLNTTGDVNMFDYDAGVVFTDKYGTHWERWEQVEDWDPDRPEEVLLYEIDVPENVWEAHTRFQDPKELKSISSTVGMDPEEVRKLGESKEVRDRVEALDIIMGTWGASYFDPSPITLTRSELKKRWGRVKMPR